METIRGTVGRLICSVFDFRTSFQTGMFEMQANSNNIASVLPSVELMSHTYRTLSLNLTFGPGIHPQLAVKADPTRLAQILVHKMSTLP